MGTSVDVVISEAIACLRGKIYDWAADVKTGDWLNDYDVYVASSVEIHQFDDDAFRSGVAYRYLCDIAGDFRTLGRDEGDAAVDFGLLVESARLIVVAVYEDWSLADCESFL